MILVQLTAYPFPDNKGATKINGIKKTRADKPPNEERTEAPIALKEPGGTLQQICKDLPAVFHSGSTTVPQ